MVESSSIKNRTILILGLLLLFKNFVVAQTNIYDSLFYGGKWRTFMVHLPTGYSPIQRYPVVLAFHGGGLLGYQSIQFQSGLNQKSDSAGFILIYPEGLKIFGNRTWNAGGCCAPSTTQNVDDVGFVDALLNDLFSGRLVDTTRVYATGFSNGALLCYRLANQLTHRLAAIAPVAGDLVFYPWNPSRAIPIVSFHSYQDQNVKYQGGVTIGATGTYFPPQDSMFSVISSNYGCQVKKDTLFHAAGQYDHFKYYNCACNAVIEQFVSFDGEHSWPGGKSSGGISVSQQFDATYHMWKFFQNYTNDCLKSGIENILDEPAVDIYPNPFQDKIYIKSTQPDSGFSLFNAQGIKVASGFRIEEFHFNNLPEGIYFLVTAQVVKKIVKSSEGATN